MKLSPEEEIFLRQWMYDEVHYQEGQGPAKRLQVENRAAPADLSLLIAAAMPEPTEQEQAARAASRDVPKWPWSEESLPARLAEAQTILAQRMPQVADSA